MPYIEPFLKLVMIGTLGTLEVFSYAVHLIAPPATAAPAEVSTAVVEACTTFFQNTSSSAAVLTTIKLNKIKVDGLYASDRTVLVDLDSGGVPGSGANRYPFQIAAVVSLQSAADRGTASKGRFYIPSPSISLVPPNQTMTPTEQAGLLLHAQQWLDSLNTALNPWTVGLVSNMRSGNEAVVTRVRVGHTFDTVRSRRNKIPEGYVEGPVPLP